MQKTKVNQQNYFQFKSSHLQQQQQTVATSSLNRSEKSFELISMLLLGSVLGLMFAGNVALAGQGCPFDDGSCREYCNQQGCNMGYCGHFAWIQCICRKCGDEWSWYDKVRYNPDKTVNQTELDSLKLNGTAPIILTNSSADQQQQAGQPNNKAVGVENKQQTLTTLLIPDLSDTNGKSELNDIPDENSDKFLDYLAKNHEKLVQATAARSGESSGGPTSSSSSSSSSSSHQTLNSQNKQTTTVGIDLDDEHDSQEEQDSQSQSSDETVEIQISTSNNNSSKDSDAGQLSTLPKIAPTAAPAISTSSTTSSPAPSASQKQQSGAGGSASVSVSESESESGSQEQAMTKLLKMAVIERASEEID